VTRGRRAPERMDVEYLFEPFRMIDRKVFKVSRKSILIVDDHLMIREGASMFVHKERNLALRGAAASPAEALAGISMAQPDVAIVDLSLGGRSGLELLKILCTRFPKLPVVVYSVHEEIVYAQRAMADGANAYVNKSQPVTNLLAALHRAAAGGGRRLTVAAEPELCRIAVICRRKTPSTEENAYGQDVQGHGPLPEFA
jgi:DNA-binding NarL/FixJ family response regulator